MARIPLVGLDAFDALNETAGRDRGTGTAFPTTDLHRGDVYHHTGLGCLMVWTGTAWRQATEPTVADTAALTSISTTYSALLYDGFTVWVADQDSQVTWNAASWDGLWTAYTPVWSAASAAAALGNGVLTGRYRKTGRLVEVNIFLSLGSTSSGGTNGWNFTLPFATAPGYEHYLTAKCWVSNGWNLLGYGLAGPSSNSIAPWMPVSPTNVNYEQVRNADGTGAVGTGRPLIPGAFTFGPNNNLAIFGRYESAT